MRVETPRGSVTLCRRTAPGWRRTAACARLYVRCAATIAKSGSLTLPAKKLFEIVKALPETDVRIEEDKNGVKVAADRFDSRMQTLPRENFPTLPEGDLSRARAHLVNRETLALVARRLGLGGAIRLGEGELRSGGTDRPSILADAMEAVIGAVFLDGGFDAARRAIDAAYADVLREADPATLGKDPKTRLQEWLQSRRRSVPEYVIVATSGEAHAQQFLVECRIAELSIVVRGNGASRRTAEQDAALKALDAVRQTDPQARG